MAKKPKNKNTVSYWKGEVWKVFSKYIRKRDACEIGSETHAKCCTCGKLYAISGVGCIQAGHFVPGRHNSYLFDEECVHAQCYHDNVGLKGNFVPYEDFMLKKYGQETVDRLKDLYRRKPITKFTIPQLKEMYKEYEKKIDELELCDVVEELAF